MADPTADAGTAPAESPGIFKGHGLILLGLMLGVLLAALDQTVVATSLPHIVGDLGEFQYFPHLVTAYLLASTIVIPVAGKFSDLYGRRPVYITGMVVFVLGSMLCGVAGNWGPWTWGPVTVSGMWQLILFRFLQGLGGGVIFPVALATVADLYAPSERGRVQGLFGGVFGLASVIGPFLGGWIVDNMNVGAISSWRWVFYVNVPVGILGVIMVATHFPKKTDRKNVPVDWFGVVTLMSALSAAILVASFGGVEYDWGSWEILALSAFAFLAAGLFILAEARAKDPLIPHRLWKEPIFTVSALASILMGSAMFGVIAFMPTYMQGVVGISATSSGAALVPLSLALVGGSIASGQLMKRFGYKVFTVAGCAIACTAFLGLWYVNTQGIPSIWVAIGIMVWLGLGLGFTIQTFTVAVQNAVERSLVGTSTAAITLFRTLGAAVGISVLGAILNRNVDTDLPPRVAKASPPVQGIYQAVLNNPYIGGKVENVPQILVADPSTLAQFRAAAAAHNLPAGTVDQFLTIVKDSFNASIGTVWLCGAAIAAAGFIIVLFLRDKPLKSSAEFHGPLEEAEAIGSPMPFH
ncbi:MAG: MDR family MFS transporter [Thermoplasmatota archaeon]